jgi:ligand-binding sensor domain-containing protein
LIGAVFRADLSFRAILRYIFDARRFRTQMIPARLIPVRRLAAVSAIALAALGLVAAAFVAWKVHSTLRHISAVVDAEDSLIAQVRPVSSATTAFDWIAPPAVFSSGAVFHDRLYLAGSAGLFEYGNRGDLLHVYRVGQQLPAAPLGAMATATLSDAHQPELLIATAGAGLLAFDGTHFRQILAVKSETVDRRSSPDESANTVTALLPLASGRLLLGTAKRGVLVYDGRRIAPFHGSLKNLYITALTGSEAELWVGTLNNGVYHWQGGEAQPIAGLPDPHVNAIAESGDAAYVATPVGVAEIAQNQVRRVLGKGIFAQSIALDGGNLAVGTIDQGLKNLPIAGAESRLGHGGTISMPGEDAAADTGAVGQIFAAGANLYAVAQSGLYQRDGDSGGWRKVIAPQPSMLTDGDVSALAIDEEGRLWVGYFDRGLDILSASLDHATHVENDHIFCVNRILPYPQRHVVNVATANGLAIFDADGREREVMGKAAGLIADHVTDVALYRGGMAVATPAGLTFLDQTGAHSLYAFQGLVNNHVYALGMRGDRLLAGTLGGISVLDNDTVTRNFTTATSGLKHNWITAVIPVDDGWLVGTYGAGVEHLTADSHFESTEATQPGVEINPNAMLVTQNHIFAGTLGRGLMVYNRRSQRWKTIAAGLPSLNVTAFAAAGGILYIGTDNGLVKIQEDRLDE